MQNYYLGIDVSKGYADFVIIDDKKRLVEKNFQLDDTFYGHCALYAALNIFFENNQESFIYAAVESTGGYENNWFNMLLRFQGTMNLKVARLNPLGVNANSKASLKRIITDKISAINVAEYLIAHPEKVMYQQDDPLRSLKKHWGFIRMLNKQRTQIVNQLESLIYTANPELLSYWKGETPMWLLTLIEKYPTASELSKAKVKAVSKIPYITYERAQAIVESAKNSVASNTDAQAAQLIKATVSQIIHLSNTIKFQTDFVEKECALPEITLLKSFPGIGTMSAIGLLIEIGAIERFSSVKKLASFFGLHPEYKTSGDSSSGFKMSKKGRKEPRQILFMVTIASLTHNPLIKSIYTHHVEKGMAKMAAIGLCMHKILRIIYGMLKNNTAFAPEIDHKNRDKKPEIKERTPKDKNRRYQDYDSKAPVSRRQHIKRKEQKSSHSDNNTKCGLTVSAPLGKLTETVS